MQTLWIIGSIVIIIVSAVGGLFMKRSYEMNKQTFAIIQEAGNTRRAGLFLQNNLLFLQNNLLPFYDELKTSSLPNVKVFWFTKNWVWIAPDDEKFPKSIQDLNENKFIKIIGNYPSQNIENFRSVCFDIKGIPGDKSGNQAGQVAQRISEECIVYHIEKSVFQRFLENGNIVQTNDGQYLVHQL